MSEDFARLPIAVVGCGDIGSISTRAVMQSSHCSLVAICDINPTMAEKAGNEHGVAFYTSVEDLLNQSRAAAVYVATPHYTHYEIGLKILLSGRHLLVEKPPTLSVTEADHLIQLSQQHSLQAACALETCVNPVVVAARRLVSGGIIGEVTQVELTYFKDKPDSYWSSGWRSEQKSTWRMHRETAGGGVLIMNGIHFLDAILKVTGLSVEKVFGMCGTTLKGIEVENSVAALLKFSNAALGSVAASASAHGGNPFAKAKIRILGTEGQILLMPQLLAYSKRSSEPSWQEYPVDVSQNTRVALFDQFARSILNRAASECDLDFGRDALALVLAVYTSCAHGQPVELR